MKIAFYDSGVGGLTIFNKVVKSIKADYIYFADNLNNPYGIKTKNEIKNITKNNVRKIIEMGVDIIVIACNTATSVAIEELRGIYKDKYIIGTEPAVKVAADKNIENKKILVCATSLTTKEEKLKKLIDKLDINEKVNFLPLDELVAFAENLDFESSFVYNYLNEKFKNIDFKKYSHLVLGCTHFPLFNKILKSIISEDIEIIDSSEGVVNNIKNTILKINKEENRESNITLILTKKDNKFIDKFINITGIRDITLKII